MAHRTPGHDYPIYPITRFPDYPIHRTAPMTMALFLEPKPRQLQSAASISAARPWFGMKSRSHAGSGSQRLMVGGRKPRSMARAAVTTPAAPLAPCGWPIMDFTDDPGTRSARSPKTSRTHRDSTASLMMVEVP